MNNRGYPLFALKRVGVIFWLSALVVGVPVEASVIFGSSDVIAERQSNFCGDTSKNLCFPLSNNAGVTLNTEAGGQAFNNQFDGFHTGNGYHSLDFDVKGTGTLNVLAARAGRIALAKTGPNNANDTFWPVIRIDHGDGYFTEYAEFSSLKTGLAVGQRVVAGAVLGTLTSPNQRSVGADHLHFQVRYDPNYDPLNPGNGSGATSSQGIVQLQSVKVGGTRIGDYQLRVDGSGVSRVTDVVLQKPIIKGTILAHFIDPKPTCTGGGAVCTGIGTNSIGWGSGSGSKSALRFPGASFDTPIEEAFELGRLYFKNATLFGGALNEITLAISTGITNNSAADDLDLNLRIAIVNTPNVANPQDSADYIYFPDYANLGSFHVLEGQDTEVALFGLLGSLHFLGFGDVTDPDAGFVRLPAPSSVPEPGVLFLVSAGLLGLLSKRIRRSVGRVKEASPKPATTFHLVPDIA